MRIVRYLNEDQAVECGCVEDGLGELTNKFSNEREK